jgi:hypothetical protein
MRSSLFSWVGIRHEYGPTWVGCQPECDEWAQAAWLAELTRADDAQ